MKTKEDIVNNWLPRYTGEKLENFGKYILLTNFDNYVHLCADWHNVEVIGEHRPMQCATAGDITIINFGMGSPGAATIMDLLTAIQPKAALFLGKCGGLKKRNKLGDLILPIAAKVRLTIISRPRCRRYRPSPCKRPSPPPSANMRWTTGQGRSIPRTAGFGSTTSTLRSTCRR